MTRFNMEKKQTGGYQEGKWWFDTDGDGHKYRLPIDQKEKFVALKNSGSDDNEEWEEFDPWMYFGLKKNLADD